MNDSCKWLDWVMMGITHVWYIGIVQIPPPMTLKDMTL